MLQEAILKVKEAETKAEEIVLDAQSKGNKLIENAKIEAKNIVDCAIDNAKARAYEALANAKTQSESQRAEFADSLREELEQSKQTALGKAQDAVAVIIDKIL